MKPTANKHTFCIFSHLFFAANEFMLSIVNIYTHMCKYIVIAFEQEQNCWSQVLFVCNEVEAQLVANDGRCRLVNVPHFIVMPMPMIYMFIVSHIIVGSLLERFPISTTV